MNGEPISKTQLPSFVEMLDVPQKNIIIGLWDMDHLSISDKIDSIDMILDKMPLEARREYRKWRFLMDRSRMPDFYDSQNEEIKIITAAIFKEFTDLEEFARIINSIKSSLNNPDAFDKWVKNEEIEFKKPLIQKDVKKDSTSQSEGVAMPLINNTMNKLAQNVNDLQVDGDNFSNDPLEVLFYLYYWNDDKDNGRICLFNSYTCSVEEIAKFHNSYSPYEVATTQNKIFGINSFKKSFEIYDLDTRQISGGPDPPEWRKWASVAYSKDKLYYLGGENPETRKNTNRVDVLIDGKWQTGPAFPLPISWTQTIACDEVLYVIDQSDNKKIYRLSDDEREGIKIGELQDERYHLGVALLNGKICITGGSKGGNVLKSCLCFDPSAPVGSRISRIADMNYERHNHSLIVANGKLYAIGGFFHGSFCNSIEEYDPQTNKWREVGEINIK